MKLKVNIKGNKREGEILILIFFQCLATIATVYWRSNEESVEGDRQQKAPVLESRETVAPSGTRADRVQGKCY